MKIVAFKTLLVGFFALIFIFLTTQKARAVDNVCLPTQPPPACGQTCTPGGVACPQDCSDCVSGTNGYTCKKAPACNVACTRDGDCEGAKDGCTACISGACKTPPACGVACTKDGDCTGAKDSCTACISGVCKTPPACGVACTKDGDCTGAAKDAGCTACTNNKCSTPFAQNMCKCDGLEAGAIIRGGKTAITAFGKVEGDDGKYAKISAFTFTLYKEADKIVTIDKKENIAAIVAETTAQKTRYKATWDLDVPSSMEKGQVYRVQAVPTCDKKTAFVPVVGNTVILGASTSNKSFFDNVASFFANLFGGGNDTEQQNSTPTATPKPVRNPQLNLKTFVPPTPTDTPTPTPTVGPAQITQQSCEFFLFKFE